MPSTPAQDGTRYLSRVASNPTPRSSAKGSKRRALVGLVTGALQTLTRGEKDRDRPNDGSRAGGSTAEARECSGMGADCIAPRMLLSGRGAERRGCAWGGGGWLGDGEGIVYIAWRKSPSAEGQSVLLVVYESGRIGMLSIAKVPLERDREAASTQGASWLPFTVSPVWLRRVSSLLTSSVPPCQPDLRSPRPCHVTRLCFARPPFPSKRRRESRPWPPAPSWSPHPDSRSHLPPQVEVSHVAARRPHAGAHAASKSAIANMSPIKPISHLTHMLSPSVSSGAAAAQGAPLGAAGMGPGEGTGAGSVELRSSGLPRLGMRAACVPRSGSSVTRHGYLVRAGWEEEGVGNAAGPHAAGVGRDGVAGATHPSGAADAAAQWALADLVGGGQRGA